MDPATRNIVPTVGRVTAEHRRRILGHGPATVWFTGLSGAGKSTLAFALEQALVERGVAAYVLDGDNVRGGLNRDLGFSPGDRAENIRRVGEVCRLLYDAGLVVLSAFISPYRADRDTVRALHPPQGFVEVHVDAPIEVCERRDVKGLYTKARTGEIPDLSGVSAPYEAPTDPELRIDTVRVSVEQATESLLEHLSMIGAIVDLPDPDPAENHGR